MKRLMAKLYTEKEHAKRLIKMLESVDDVCFTGCPASKCFNISSGLARSRTDGDVCHVCWGFLGWDVHESKIKFECPCDSNKDKVVKATWLALEEKGYLK